MCRKQVLAKGPPPRLQLGWLPICRTKRKPPPPLPFPSSSSCCCCPPASAPTLPRRPPPSHGCRCRFHRPPSLPLSRQPPAPTAAAAAAAAFPFVQLAAARHPLFSRFLPPLPSYPLLQSIYPPIPFFPPHPFFNLTLSLMDHFIIFALFRVIGNLIFWFAW